MSETSRVINITFEKTEEEICTNHRSKSIFPKLILIHPFGMISTIDPKLTTSNLLYDYLIFLGEGLIEDMKPFTFTKKEMILTIDPANNKKPIL